MFFTLLCHLEVKMGLSQGLGEFCRKMMLDLGVLLRVSVLSAWIQVWGVNLFHALGPLCPPLSADFACAPPSSSGEGLNLQS